MPTYEYRCGDCSHEFELFQRMSDEPVASCPQCGGRAERLLSAGAGLLFKGEGFYITDYRSESYKKKAEKETPGSGRKEGGGSDSASKASGDAGSGSTPSSGAGGGSAGGDD